MKNLLLLPFLLLLISCTSDKDENLVNDFSGYYKITSIVSETPIDLNNDGLKSQDFLQEIKTPFVKYDGELIDFMYNNESPYHFAEVRPLSNQSNSTKFLNISVPKQVIDSIYLGNDTYVKMNMSYERMITYLIYKFTKDNIEIESKSLGDLDIYDIKNFKISRINKFEFEIFFDFKVYDFTENEWIETTLNTTYIKV